LSQNIYICQLLLDLLQHNVQFMMIGWPLHLMMAILAHFDKRKDFSANYDWVILIMPQMFSHRKTETMASDDNQLRLVSICS